MTSEKKCLFPYKQIKNQRNNLPFNALRKETCQIQTRLKEMKLDANGSLYYYNLHFIV